MHLTDFPMFLFLRGIAAFRVVGDALSSSSFALSPSLEVSLFVCPRRCCVVGVAVRVCLCVRVCVCLPACALRFILMTAPPLLPLPCLHKSDSDSFPLLIFFISCSSLVVASSLIDLVLLLSTLSFRSRFGLPSLA